MTILPPFVNIDTVMQILSLQILSKTRISRDIMVGRNPRFEIEIMIIQELQEESQLRYTDLREKVDSRCQVLGLKKPSNDAFYSRLNNLCYKDVLVREIDRYGGTYYSMKNNHYIGYLERTFSSLHKYRMIPFRL